MAEREPSHIPSSDEHEKESVQILGLSKITTNKLKRLGIFTVGELVTYTRDELLYDEPNFGEGIVRQIETKLAELKLQLLEEPDWRNP